MKFSEAYVSLNIDLGPIKAPSFLDFADQTEQIWKNCHVVELLGVLPLELLSLTNCCVAQHPADLPPKTPHSLHLHPLTNKQKYWAYKAYLYEIYGHFLKISLLFLYKFYFQKPISHLISIWNPLNIHHYLDYADQTEQLRQI